MSFRGCGGVTGAFPGDALKKCEHVREVDFARCALSGALVGASMRRLRALTALRLAGNRLTGKVPNELGMLPALEELELDTNALRGRIPDTLSGLPRLRRLALSRNQLTGPIPHTLGRCAELRELHVHANRLTGIIPKELGRCPELRELRAGHNPLSGLVPSQPAGASTCASSRSSTRCSSRRCPRTSAAALETLLLSNNADRLDPRPLRPHGEPAHARAALEHGPVRARGPRVPAAPQAYRSSRSRGSSGPKRTTSLSER